MKKINKQKNILFYQYERNAFLGNSYAYLKLFIYLLWAFWPYSHCLSSGLTIMKKLINLHHWRKRNSTNILEAATKYLLARLTSTSKSLCLCGNISVIIALFFVVPPPPLRLLSLRSRGYESLRLKQIVTDEGVKIFKTREDWGPRILIQEGKLSLSLIYKMFYRNFKVYIMLESGESGEIRDHLQISLLILSKFKRVNYLCDFKSNKSQLIRSDWFNI